MPIWHSLFCEICKKPRMFKYYPKHPLDGISYWKCEHCHHKIRYDEKEKYLAEVSADLLKGEWL